MMKLAGLLFLSLISLQAVASVELYPVNYQARFERNQDQQIMPRSALNFAAGLTFGPWAGLVEASFFDEVTGTKFTNITRRHQELVFWGRYERPIGPAWALSLAAGAGLSREDVESRLREAESVKDQGGDQMLGAVSAGTSLEIQKTLRLSLEGRLFFSSNRDPNPQPDVVVRTGFRF